MSTSASLHELVAAYVAELKRQNSSEHTVRNYESDLLEFAGYFNPQPALAEWDATAIREWLGWLYQRGLAPVSIRRKLAAVRSLFTFLQHEHLVERNPAKLVRTPKMPKTLPPVMTPEQTNSLLDEVSAGKLERPYPERDLAIFEVLYGCGVRVSELVGLDLEDVDAAQGWIRVRGKGKKERQVPLIGGAAAALERYLSDRNAPVADERAIFLNARGKRLTDRSVRSIVKLYATVLSGDSSIHPHSFRHAYATHLLADGADLRSIQELLGHSRLSTTQRYTQVALADLMATYDKAHPKA
jgi:integrase/recombinase XerC